MKTSIIALTFFAMLLIPAAHAQIPIIDSVVCDTDFEGIILVVSISNCYIEDGPRYVVEAGAGVAAHCGNGNLPVATSIAFAACAIYSVLAAANGSYNQGLFAPTIGWIAGSVLAHSDLTGIPGNPEQFHGKDCYMIPYDSGSPAGSC